MPNHQCPRCQSTDTRFGYFNNQKTSQPRYFCKACRRYWTLGGKLRDIPAREVVKKARPYRDPSLSTSSGGGSGNLPFSNGGFTLATENPSCSPPPASQIIFTQGSVKSLLREFNNGLNPFTASPVRQAQGRDQGLTVGQVYQLPNRVQGIAAHPDGATGMWMPPIISTTPASSTTITSYTPVTANVATTCTSVASSTNWSSHLPSFGNFA